MSLSDLIRQSFYETYKICYTFYYSFFEDECMKKFIPYVLFCGFVLSSLFLSCEPTVNQKDEPTPTLSSIIISQKPAKLSYDYDEALDLTGLVVKAKYSDGSEKTVSGWTSSPDPWTKLTTSGSVTVTITYEEKTTSFTITVAQKPVEKTLTSIYLSKNPDKLSYEYNSLLDFKGIEVKGMYSDGTESVIDDWTSSLKSGTALTTSGTVKVTISYSGKTTSFTISVKEKPVITSNEYFWGTWVRMDNGAEYEVLETSVVQGNQKYAVNASDASTLSVATLGTFTKESDGVMICNNIPYYRKGGANLEYSLKLVGFTTGRAAGTAMSGIKGKGKSTKYSNFESNSESDSEGNIKFTAPTANDTQTVEIENGNDLVVVSGLNISNSGDYMGTVALVGKDDYNLKITGTISDDQKDNGYLFGNNAKTYNMQLTITNISENKCSTSGCSIESEDAKLVLDSETNLKGFTISTLAGGATKTINLSLSYGEITEPYVDTGIIVTIENPLTNQIWEDYIPLRFFKGTIPITVAAKNPENNSNAALNGFVIYPDGNNQFFAIKHNDCKPIFVPTFGKEKPYKLVFSGATVTSQLDDSTEMYYSVEPASVTPRIVVTDGMEAIRTYVPFGGDNHSEDKAYIVNDGFEAYLSEGEIDYYKITADSDTYYGPGGSIFYSVSYENEKGDVPDTFLTTEGAVLTTIQLPQMTCDGYDFLGWYSGNTKATAGGYTVYDNITLKAKWQLESYPVVYNLNGGTNHAANPSGYTIESSLITLQAPARTGYDFGGWYSSESLSGTAIESIGGGATGAVTLYAKWTPVSYSITYNLNDGTNAAANPATYTIETDTITLATPQKEGFTFAGWYTSSSFSGTKQTEIAKGSTGNKTYYAKWLKKCTVSYVTAHGTAPTAIIVGEGEKLTSSQLPELTNSDYFFGGWYVGETRVTAGSYTVTDDVTLTAKWSDKCNVSYVTAHGTAPQSFDVESGTTLTAANLPSLTESGWKFLGWYTNSSYDEDKKASAGQSVTTSLTLYAKWEEYTGPDDGFVFVEGGTVVGSDSYNANYTGAFPYGRMVKISSFYMSDHEVTQGEYTAVMGSNPSYFSSSPASGEVQTNRPVENINWYDAIYFCNKYSESAGLTPCYSVNGNTNVSSWSYTPHNNNIISGTITCDMTANGYRLPTEAEWEYAARGGQKTYGTTVFANYFAGKNTTNYSASSNSDLDTVGWYASNCSSMTHQVKKKSPNALGLYDMSGNVCEWCWDWINDGSGVGGGSVTDPCGVSSGSYRLKRGGSLYGNANACSVSNRNGDLPSSRFYFNGFRVVRSDIKIISYITNHGTAPEEKKIRNYIDVSSLPTLTESGWSFKGWYTDSVCSDGNKVETGYEVTQNITLYAKWEEYTGPDDGFVFVEGGTFSMGSTSGGSDEKPVHNVTLSSFYISDHELTQGEYQAVMGSNPSNFKSSPVSGEVQVNRPVETVSWYDAIYFCNKYSESVGLTPCYSVNGSTSVSSWNYTPHNDNSISGTITCNWTANGYRLPTEAEWEYAAKGGKQSKGDTYSGSNSIDNVAWYTSNSSSKTHEVKKKVANELGLFDMSGNVWEWCWDWSSSSYSSDSVNNPHGASSGSYRVARGGSWYGSATCCRTANRGSLNPYYRYYDLGFRLVRSAQ